MNWREDLRAIIDEVAVAELPDVMGELARGQARALLRLQSQQPQNGTPPAPDQYLTVGEVAALLRVSRKWVYANADQLGAVHLSSRAVRFPERAVQRYVAGRRSTR